MFPMLRKKKEYPAVLQKQLKLSKTGINSIVLIPLQLKISLNPIKEYVNIKIFVMQLCLLKILKY